MRWTGRCPDAECAGRVRRGTPDVTDQPGIGIAAAFSWLELSVCS
jgi:hypothetical protein